MQYVVIPRRVSLLIYGDDPVNYIASCQINLNGDRGTIDTLNGAGFYELLKAEGIGLFQALGLSVIGAAVSPAHCRLITRALRDVATVTVDGPTRVGGRDLVWISIRAKEPSCAASPSSP